MTAARDLLDWMQDHPLEVAPPHLVAAFAGELAGHHPPATVTGIDGQLYVVPDGPIEHTWTITQTRTTHIVAVSPEMAIGQARTLPDGDWAEQAVAAART